MPRVEATPFPSPDSLVPVGPTVRVHVSSKPAFKPQSKQQTSHRVREAWALVDTGSNASSIDSRLAQDLGLRPVDQQIVAGVGGEHAMSLFLARIYVPELKHAINGKFVGVHLKEGGQIHDVLLGRDFLSDYVMIYDGVTNRVTLLK